MTQLLVRGLVNLMIGVTLKMKRVNLKMEGVTYMMVAVILVGMKVTVRMGVMMGVKMVGLGILMMY